MSQVFRLNHVEALRLLRRRTIVRLSILGAIVLAISGWMMHNADLSASKSWIFWFPTALAIMVFASVRGFQRSKEQLRSFTLTIIDDRITRRMIGLTDFAILKNSITVISKSNNGVLTIHGDSPQQLIQVPLFVEDRNRLCALLAEWKPITQEPQRKMRFVWIAASFLFLASGILSFAMRSRPWVIPSAAIFLAMCAVYLWIIQRGPHVDARTKRGSWWILAPAFGVLARTILVLSPETW